MSRHRRKGIGTMGKFTPEQELEICEMYEQVERGRIVAERYGVSTETIYRILKKHDIPRTHRHSAVEKRKTNRRCVRLDWSDSDVADIIQLYQGGLTCSQIGEKYSCSWSSVRRALRSHGIKLRTRGRKKSDVEPKERRDAKRARDRKRAHAVSDRRHDGPARGLRWRDIADRDNMRCQICGRVVDVSDRWINERGNWCYGRLYPTLDHIVALSNGGTDTYDNVQLACKRCNSKKQDKGQMRLAI